MNKNLNNLLIFLSLSFVLINNAFSQENFKTLISKKSTTQFNFSRLDLVLNVSNFENVELVSISENKIVFGFYKDIDKNAGSLAKRLESIVSLVMYNNLSNAGKEQQKMKINGRYYNTDKLTCWENINESGYIELILFSKKSIVSEEIKKPKYTILSFVGKKTLLENLLDYKAICKINTTSK